MLQTAGDRALQAMGNMIEYQGRAYSVIRTINAPYTLVIREEVVISLFYPDRINFQTSFIPDPWHFGTDPDPRIRTSD